MTRPPFQKPHFEGDVASLVSTLTKDLAEPIIVIGPMVWQPSDGLKARVDYFMTASKGLTGYRCEQIIAGPEGRSSLLFALMQVRPTVIHTCEDELYMAELCAALWPCGETRRILENMRVERAGRPA